MAKQEQPDRWESAVLAAAMAVAGSLFLFDKLGSLFRAELGSLIVAVHAAPVLLLAIGLGLLLAEPGSSQPEHRPFEKRSL